MATRGELTLKGLDAYLEAFVKAGVDVDKVAGDSLDEGADEVVREMVRLVPVDKGNLRANLDKDGPHQEGNFVFVEVGLTNPDRETAIYGNVQEYGSSSVAAQPYVRPAIRSKKNVIKKVLQKTAEAFGLKV